MDDNHNFETGGQYSSHASANPQRPQYERTPVESALAQALRLRGARWPIREACKPDTKYRLSEFEMAILEPKHVRELAYRQTMIWSSFGGRSGGTEPHLEETLRISAWQYEANRKIRLGSSDIAFRPDGQRYEVVLKGTLGYRFQALVKSFDESRDRAWVKAEPMGGRIREGVFRLSQAALDAIIKDMVTGTLVYDNERSLSSHCCRLRLPATAGAALVEDRAEKVEAAEPGWVKRHIPPAGC